MVAGREQNPSAHALLVDVTSSMLPLPRCHSYGTLVTVPSCGHRCNHGSPGSTGPCQACSAAPDRWNKPDLRAGDLPCSVLSWVKASSLAAPCVVQGCCDSKITPKMEQEERSISRGKGTLAANFQGSQPKETETFSGDTSCCPHPGAQAAGQAATGSQAPRKAAQGCPHLPTSLPIAAVGAKPSSNTSGSLSFPLPQS